MMNEKNRFSYLFGSNAPYIEELYEAYLSDPDSVSPEWQGYFRELAALPVPVSVRRLSCALSALT